MAQEQVIRRIVRLSRRAALRIGSRVSAVGAGLALGATWPSSTPALAVPVGWRKEHLEVGFIPVGAVSIVRAGSGPPQRGDAYFNEGLIYGEVTASGEGRGPQIGIYRCFGPWVSASTDTTIRENRFTVVEYHLTGRGLITGLIDEGGSDGSAHIGAVHGGTGEFIGALGVFRQVVMGTPAVAVQVPFDLLLPDLS
jgi:hypothetical protein